MGIWIWQLFLFLLIIKSTRKKALFASKNNGNFNFTLYSSDAVKYGGWLTMDAGDFNGDEKQDLMLGNFSVDTIFKASIDWEE